ncbi:uncharacterized protein N7500_010578 [Penicillium coprophilum]|uniref:uncharacterized protein n=1 Tax=Penicillium coprophilum TaxID=36646 RepID=UPI00239E322A|nr:uncharacterized protein N7500_010578 [Penicillium coprophilum]KAJ5150389.1 hypothetical protein N7500_010578 [Penicillium coprophilum]
MKGLLNSPQRPHNQLRKACNFCHQSKLDIPCRYEYVVRTGKPKGSRNKKTLEKAQMLRQEAMMTTGQLYSQPAGKDGSSSSSSSSSSSTNSATSEGEHPRADMSTGDDILMPLNWDNKWIMFTNEIEPQPHKEIGLQPDEAMGWGHTEEALQLAPLPSTDLPFTPDCLSLLNASIYDTPTPEAIPRITSIASQQCACVGHIQENVVQLSSLTQDPCKRDRFDRGMQIINNAWVAIRATLQCESSEHHSQPFFSMLWCIRLACGWFQSRASLEQREAPIPSYPPPVKGIDIRCGEYEIPHKQIQVMHGLLIHMAVRDGIDLLRGLRCILEKKEPSTHERQANVVSLTAVDVQYILSALAYCEEEMGLGLRA